MSLSANHARILSATGLLFRKRRIAVFNLTSSGPVGADEIFVSKLDPSGNFLWAKSYGGTDEDRGYSIAVDVKGNTYTTGYFRDIVDFDPGPGVFNLTSAGASDIFISKLDSSGNFIWAKRLGGGNGDIGASIAVDGTGNVYTTGAFIGTADFDPGPGVFNLTPVTPPFSDEVFVSKLDSSGNFVWAKSMGGPNTNDAGNSITVDATGNVYTTGHFADTADFDPGLGIFNLFPVWGMDIFISKLDALGNFIYAKNAGSQSRS